MTTVIRGLNLYVTVRRDEEKQVSLRRYHEQRKEAVPTHLNVSREAVERSGTPMTSTNILSLVNPPGQTSVSREQSVKRVR